MQLIEGIWLPDGDTHFQRHLELGPRFEDVGSYQLRKIYGGLDWVSPKRRSVAVDVGAHVGLWSRVLATSFQSVVAFEPMPHLVECYRRNMKEFDNVFLHECALSDADGRIGLVRDDANSGNCRVVEEGEIPSIMVDAVRLDDIALTRIDFLKIDVEGWEQAVVRGGEERIKRDKPVIVVEQKTGHGRRYGLTDDGAAHLLTSWGAVIRWVRAGDYCLSW